MNKREAKNQAYENTRTLGELKELINQTRGAREMSVVNKAFTLDAVLDMFDGFVDDKISESSPESLPKSSIGNVMGITNILRECA